MKNSISKTASRKPAPKLPAARQEKTVTVIFYCGDDDRELFRVEMFAALYAEVERACKKLKIQPAQFFKLAVDEMVQKLTPAKGGRS